MRTKNSILNVMTELLPFFFMGLLGFVRTSVFIDLGDEIYSLNQLFLQIFSYLNLAEAGVGTAITYSLYKPLQEERQDKINSIMSGANRIFNIVGIVVLTAGLALSFFVHYLTKTNVLSQDFVQLTFVLFLVRSSVDYFMFTPRYLIQADQRKYKINLQINTYRILETIIEIVLAYNGINYFIILIPGIFMRFLANIHINKVVYKKYPYLDIHKKEKNFESLDNTKYIFLFRVADLVLYNTDIILLSTFVGLKVAGFYSVYNQIMEFLRNIVNRITRSLIDSFGQMMVSETNEKAYSIYKEVNTALYYSGFVICLSLSLVVNSFIAMWAGPNYVLDQVTLMLFIINLYNGITTSSFSIITNAGGLFKENKNLRLLEALLNIAISFALVFEFGIKGVLIGTILSEVAIRLTVYAKRIYNKVFEKPWIQYISEYLLNTLWFLLCTVALHKIGYKIMSSEESLLLWFVKSIALFSAITLINAAIYYGVSKSFRSFVGRLVGTLKKKR